MNKVVLVPLLAFSLVVPTWAADQVTLNYGWKPGLQVKVSGYQTKEKVAAGQPQPAVKINMAYTMATVPHDAGLQIDYSDVEIGIDSEDERMQGWMKSYMEAVAGAIPSSVINAKGEMAGATGVAELRNKLISGLESLLVDLPAEQVQQIIGGISQVYTEELLNQQLAAEWNLNVAQWIGGELEDDGAYELEFDMPVPALGNQLVKTLAQYEFSGRVNCNDADKSQQCVRLHYRSQTDGISATELLKKLMPADMPVPDINVSMVTEFEMISDPTTLLPFYTKQIKRSSSPVETPDGIIEVTQIETSEYHHSYVNVK